MANLDTTALNVALPSIARGLHTSISGAQWTIASYTVVLACLLVFGGSLGDRIGRRTVFQFGLLIFAAGSLACSMAPSLGWLIVFRMTQAVGGAMLTPSAMGIIAAVFTDPVRRVRAIGVWSGALGISMAAGPVLGGFLVENVGWRAVFWINVPIAAIALAATVIAVPQSRSATPRAIDPIGQLLVIGLLGPLVFAIIEGPHRGWAAPVTLGGFALALSCLVLLRWYEPRRREPLIELPVFASPAFSGAFVISILAFAAIGGFLFLNTFYLQEILADGPLRAGTALLPMAAAMFVTGPVSGRLIAAHGARSAFTVGAVVATAAALLLGYTFDSGGRLSLLFGYALFGAGLGLINTPITATAVAGLPGAQAALAASLATTSRQVGMTLGVAIIGSILASDPGALRSAADFHVPATFAWQTITAMTLAALIVTRISTGPWARRRLSLPVGPRGPRPTVPPPLSRPMLFAPAR